jgi:hypothetical protein
LHVELTQKLSIIGKCQTASVMSAKRSCEKTLFYFWANFRFPVFMRRLLSLFYHRHSGTPTTSDSSNFRKSLVFVCAVSVRHRHTTGSESLQGPAKCHNRTRFHTVMGRGNLQVVMQSPTYCSKVFQFKTQSGRCAEVGVYKVSSVLLVNPALMKSLSC